MAPLTDGQEMLLALLPILPAMLSMFCSLTILRIVYKHYCHKGQTTVYHRLLVGMSICDVFVSFWFPWIAFLMPASTSTRIWAIGTTGTCTFMGFLFNFAFTGLLYNTSLSYYFLLTARYGWRDKEIAKCVEPTMHTLVVAFPITCGLVFVALGVYAEQPLGLGCWVGDYPHGCGTEPGQEECITPMLGWISAGIPVVVSFVSLLVNNGLIYCHVRATIQKAKRHSSHFLATNQSSSRLSIYSTQHHRPPKKKDAQARRLQSVAVQAGLYLLVFLLNYIWTMILRNIGADEKYWTDEHESDLFWLLVLQAIFLPLQGFFNLCVFSRPKYLRTRKQFPKESRLWVFRRAMFGEGKAPMHAAAYDVTATAATTNHNPSSNAMAPPTTLRSSTNRHHHPVGAKEDPIAVEKAGSDDSDDNNDTTKGTVSERLEPEPMTDVTVIPEDVEQDSNLPFRSSSSSQQPPRVLRKSTSLHISSMRLLDLLGISSRHRRQRQDDDDDAEEAGHNNRHNFLSPFEESTNRPLQQSEFDSFLFGCEDFSDFVDEARNNSNVDSSDDGAEYETGRA